MHISRQGVAFLRRLEGSKPWVYQDAVGIFTLGVGHKLTPSEMYSGEVMLPSFGPCRYGKDPWPDEWIDDLLRADLAWVEDVLYRLVHTLLEQHQYDSLCCFVFNIGAEAFRRSTLLARLSSDDCDAVPEQLRRWVYAGGRIRVGLRQRRKQEERLWSHGDYGVSTTTA